MTASVVEGLEKVWARNLVSSVRAPWRAKTGTAVNMAPAPNVQAKDIVDYPSIMPLIMEWGAGAIHAFGDDANERQRRDAVGSLSD